VRFDEEPYCGPIEKSHRIKKAPLPLRAVNPERQAKREETDFGAHGDFVRKLPCIIARLHPKLRSGCFGRVVAAHFKSRGAGGDRFSLFPLCEGHHLESHTVGSVSFQELYELDLAIEVEVLNLADPSLSEEEHDAAQGRLSLLREPR
jgi:hypothetical protein